MEKQNKKVVFRNLTFKCEYEDEEFGNVEIIGLAMTYGFEEDKVTDEGEEIKIPRDDKGKVFSDFFDDYSAIN